MSVHQADSRTFDSTAPPIQGNTKSRKSSYAILTIGIISMAIGIIGILAHQGVLGKKVLDSLKKIPDSIGGKDLVLGVSIVLVGLPPIVLLICIAKSERDVDTIKGAEHVRRYVHIYDRQSRTLKVTHDNVSNIFIIQLEVVTEWSDFSYNAGICVVDNKRYVLSIHYKNRNDQSCIHHTVFTIVPEGIKTSYETRVAVSDGTPSDSLVVESSSNIFGNFDSFIKAIVRQIKDAKEPLKSLTFQGPNGLLKKSLS